MKILAMVAIVAAALCLVAGGGMIIIDGTLKLLSPNALLRLTDTSLLFAIAVLLFAIASREK